MNFLTDLIREENGERRLGKIKFNVDAMVYRDDLQAAHLPSCQK